MRYSFGKLPSNNQVDLPLCIPLYVGISAFKVRFILSFSHPCSVVISKTGSGLGYMLCFDKKHVCKNDARRLLKDISVFLIAVFVPLHPRRKFCQDYLAAG